MADLNFSLGIQADGLIKSATDAVKALDGMDRTAANVGKRLIEQNILLKRGENALAQHKLAQLNVTDQQRAFLKGILNENQAIKSRAEAQIQAAAQEKAAVEQRIAAAKEWQTAFDKQEAQKKAVLANVQKQKSAVAQTVATMQHEAAMLGKSAAAQKLYELRTQGATQAQLKQAAAAQAQIAAHNRLQGARFTMPTFAAGLVGGVGAAGIIRMADDWTVFNNRLKLVTQSSEELKTAQQGILAIANRTGQDLGKTAEVYQRLAANQDALKLNGEELLDITETINKAIVVGGSTAEGASAALMQFGQAMASGVLRGQEFNSVMEQAPGLSQALAEGLGVGIGQLRSMAHAGELTAQRVTQALQKASGSVAAQFAKMDLTIAQSATIFKNRLTEFIGGASESSKAAKTLSSAIRLAAGNIDVLATGLGVLVSLGVAKWTITSAASLVQMGASALLLAGSSSAATGANAALATSIDAVGVRATLASFQVTGFSGSLAVLRTAAVATTAKLWAMIAPLALFALGAAAVAASVTALSASLRAAKGQDASNWISDGFDGVLDTLGLIDSRVESLGTKLHDLTQEPLSFKEKLTLALGPMGGLIMLGKRWYDSLQDSNKQLEKSKALVEAVQATSGYTSVAGKIDKAGGVAQYRAQNMGLEDLQKSLGDTVVKYREQSAVVGKSTAELEKMRLAAEKTALLEKQKQKFEEKYAEKENKDELIRQNMALSAAQIEKDFQAASRAIDEAERATKMHTAAQNAQTEALKRAKQVQDGIAGLQEELARVGKSAQEIRLMDLQKAGATAEQLAQAKSLLDMIAAKEKAFEATQSTFDSAGSSFQSAADGMNAAADKMNGGGESIIDKRYRELMAKANAYNMERNANYKTTAGEAAKSRKNGDSSWDNLKLSDISAAREVIRDGASQLEQALSEASLGMMRAQQVGNKELAQAYGKSAKVLHQQLNEQQAQLTYAAQLRHAYNQAQQGSNQAIMQGNKELAQAYGKSVQAIKEQLDGLFNTPKLESAEIAAAQQQTIAAQNLNLASENLDQAAKAVQAAVTLPQAQPLQNVQDMGRVTLDLRQPDGKTLTGVLFGNKDFLAKFKTGVYQGIDSYVNDMHAALS